MESLPSCSSEVGARRGDQSSNCLAEENQVRLLGPLPSRLREENIMTDSIRYGFQEITETWSKAVS